MRRLWLNFLVSVSKKAAEPLSERIREMEIHKQTGVKIDMIAETIPRL